jgi:hypothetical protein
MGRRGQSTLTTRPVGKSKDRVRQRRYWAAILTRGVEIVMVEEDVYLIGRLEADNCLCRNSAMCSIRG